MELGVASQNQCTLQRAIGCQGVGLHSGAKVQLTLRPAPADHGVVFVRTDLPHPVQIPALSQYVVDTSLATTLGKDDVRVGTVEHLLAALSGLGVDNVRVEVSGPEVPIMDGSAAPFAALVREAGLRELSEPRSFLLIKRPVCVVEDGKEASLAPANRLRIHCTIDFRHPLISDQIYEVELSDHAFAREIARARTFGFLRDVEMLKKMGLAKGGSLENAIVVDDFSILNSDGLRFSNEFVRHKILDAVGDLAMFGRPVLGHLKVHKSGHALHHKLVQRVLADPSQYEVVCARQKDMDPLELRLPDLAGNLEPLEA